MSAHLSTQQRYIREALYQCASSHDPRCHRQVLDIPPDGACTSPQARLGSAGHACREDCHPSHDVGSCHRCATCENTTDCTLGLPIPRASAEPEQYLLALPTRGWECDCTLPVGAAQARQSTFDSPTGHSLATGHANGRLWSARRRRRPPPCALPQSHREN